MYQMEALQAGMDYTVQILVTVPGYSTIQLSDPLNLDILDDGSD